ncbi:MAG TPA: hypothetical protein ENH62_06715 [Marinobacter sp.]|nr:hypothetical protein [Marinobacter sp.]
MADEHWTNGFEAEGLGDDNREAFTTHMAKFPTQAAAVMDGYGLAKQKGVAFKLPESIEKLPDDASRATLLAQVNKLYGREIPLDLDGLADLDMKAGSTAEGEMYDETLAKAFKEWVIAEKVEKSVAQKAIKFHNEAMAFARTAYAAKTEEATKTAVTERLAAVTACNDALVTTFGSKEKLDEQTVRMHRALLNNTGCSTEEAADIADFLKNREGATNTALRRILISNLAPLATESLGPDGKPTTVAAGVVVKDQEGSIEQKLWGKKT